jgi:hypothetical protein
MRIPRKKKKFYKNHWKKRGILKCSIKKNSIEKVDGIWGCLVDILKSETV